VWIIKEPARAKATRVYERIEAALEVAEQNLDQVKVGLARARTRLDEAREEQRNLAQERSNNALRQKLIRMVQRGIAPELGNANEKLHTIAEAAVVVNSILEDLGNIPILSVAGLDLDSLTEVNAQIARAGPAAWELNRLLGEPEPDADAAVQESRIERALQSMKGLIADFEPQLTDVRRRTEELKSKTLPWITPGTILISGMCLWIALSQVSFMFHAFSWWKRRDQAAPPAVPQ
jgi:hypothetical protein